MAKNREIEIVEMPVEHYNFAVKMTGGFVKHCAEMARFGTLDIQGLAVACYLQGVWDGAQVAERRMEEGNG